MVEGLLKRVGARVASKVVGIHRFFSVNRNRGRGVMSNLSS